MQHNCSREFNATPFGILPVIDPLHTERAIYNALSGGQVYGWEALAELAGASTDDVKWTCDRLRDHNRFTVLTREFILDAFEFANKHNPHDMHI